MRLLERFPAENKSTGLANLWLLSIGFVELNDQLIIIIENRLITLLHCLIKHLLGLDFFFIVLILWAVVNNTLLDCETI
jgi:hypothetical protein